MQLFCLPHAGSSALNYFQWKPYMRPGVEIVPLEFPGRGKKSNLAPCTTMGALTEQIFGDFLKKYTGGVYAFYGHSLGAWVVYALYARIEQEGMMIPKLLFFSGNYPPFLHKELYIRENMEDREVIERMIALGGTGRYIFEEPKLYKRYLQTMRADFLAAEDFRRQASIQQIQSYVVALGGAEDSNVTTRELLLWKRTAVSSCTIIRIKGNHFFPFTNLEDTVAIINKQIEAIEEI